MKLWQTALSGALGLALLEASTSSTQAAGRVGSLLTGVSGLIARVLDPTVPAIPDLRTKAPTIPSDDNSDSDSSGTVTATPAATSTDWSTSATALYA